MQCDVTDRQALHQILANLRIDIVVHLATLLETTADTERRLRVNINGCILRVLRWFRKASPEHLSVEGFL